MTDRATLACLRRMVRLALVVHRDDRPHVLEVTCMTFRAAEELHRALSALVDDEDEES